MASPLPPVPAAQPTGHQVEALPHLRPAGCLVRSVALVVDLILLSVGLALANTLLDTAFELELSRTLLDPQGRVFDALEARYGFIWRLLIIFVPLLYFVILEATGRAATLGKRIVGICVVAHSGKRAGLLRTFFRTLGKMLSAVPALVGFVIAILPGKRALHDLLTGSRVVHRNR